MSKRSDFLEKAVFFAQQDPKLLAGFLSEHIADVPASIVITGSALLENDNVDGSVHTGYSAKAYNQFGDELADAVTLALKAPVSGVSISEGVVTLTSAVADGTTFIVKGTVAANATVAEFLVTVLVRAVDHIVITGPATLENSATLGLTSDPYTAEAFDANDVEVVATITFALATPVEGVSIHATTGVVTLTNAVADATEFTIVASAANSAVTEELLVTVLVRAVDHIVVSGDAVLVNDSTNGLTSDAYTAVAYDENDVEVVATITFALKEPVAGVSINANTGVVTLTSTVADETAFIIVASDANSLVTAEFPVTVSVPVE